MFVAGNCNTLLLRVCIYNSVEKKEPKNRLFVKDLIYKKSNVVNDIIKTIE